MLWVLSGGLLRRPGGRTREGRTERVGGLILVVSRGAEAGSVGSAGRDMQPSTVVVGEC